MDSTYEITDLNITGAGKIIKMKVNGKGVDIVTDITKNDDDGITAISINGVNQNIAGITAYAWTSDDVVNNSECTYTNFDSAPADDTELTAKKVIKQNNNVLSVDSFATVFPPEAILYTKVSDTSFTLKFPLKVGSKLVTFTRDDTKDFVLW